jgi:DNA-binding HxlR family transcriptional regulator
LTLCNPLSSHTPKVTAPLEEDGLIERQVYAVVPPKVEYRLSPFGQTLTPVLDAIANWGVQNNGAIVARLAGKSG